MADGGNVFLDELPEHSRNVLEALRESPEHGAVTLRRAGETTTLPAPFRLVAAMNPCPCGERRSASIACDPMSGGRDIPLGTLAWAGRYSLIALAKAGRRSRRRALGRLEVAASVSSSPELMNQRPKASPSLSTRATAAMSACHTRRRSVALRRMARRHASAAPVAERIRANRHSSMPSNSAKPTRAPARGEASPRTRTKVRPPAGGAVRVPMSLRPVRARTRLRRYRAKRFIDDGESTDADPPRPQAVL